MIHFVDRHVTVLVTRCEMEIEKLFKVLVVGGSMLTTGCGGTTTTVGAGHDSADLADASEDADARDDAVADVTPGKDQDAEAGVTSWLSWA